MQWYMCFKTFKHTQNKIKVKVKKTIKTKIYKIKKIKKR